MFRIIMWAALIAIAIWFVKRLINPPTPKKRPQPPEDAAAPMVRCANCGVHLPRDRALSQEQQWYCSESHRLEGPAARDR